MEEVRVGLEDFAVRDVRAKIAAPTPGPKRIGLDVQLPVAGEYTRPGSQSRMTAALAGLDSQRPASTSGFWRRL